MNDKRYFFFDVDGTLTDRATDRIVPSAKEALEVPIFLRRAGGTLQSQGDAKLEKGSDDSQKRRFFRRAVLLRLCVHGGEFGRNGADEVPEG